LIDVMSDVFNGYDWYPLTRSCNFSHLIDSTLPFFNDEKGRAVFNFFFYFFKWKEQTKEKHISMNFILNIIYAT